MKKLYLFCLSCLLLFNSCIEIVEKIDINPDKSGKISFSINGGYIGAIAFKVLNKYVDMPFVDEIKKQSQMSAENIKSIKGIKNVEYISDDKKSLYYLGFEFKNSKKLNVALYKIFGYRKGIFKPYIKITKKKLVKRNIFPALRFWIKKNKKSFYNKNLFEKITYKTVYSFPSKIKKTSNKKAVIKEDKKTVVFQCNFDEILNTDISVRNKIKY